MKGYWGWLGITLYVIGYDVVAAYKEGESLSTAFYNAVEHPVRRWFVILLWTMVTAHLFHLVPRRYDPICLVADEVYQLINRNRA